MPADRDVDCCDFLHAHEDLVEAVRERMPDEDILYDLTELFRLFGDSTRLRILYVLFESELCVCDIARHFPSAASFEKRPAGQIPPGREDRILLSGR